MIKTSINRHDLEYYLYAMVKAFYKEALVVAPDTAEHNQLADDENADEDFINCILDENKLKIQIKKGIFFKEDQNFIYEVSDDKDLIKAYIYDALSEYSGIKLPWGNLTGIRPTKLYLQKLKNRAYLKNCSFDSTENIEAVKDSMKTIHRLSDYKNDLAAKIAVTEEKIIESMHGYNGYSLYIGIPFCPSTCLYCSFTSNPIFSYKNKIDAYLDAVKLELLATRNIMADYKLDSIYIGGGTPSALDADKIDRLLNDIVSIIDISNIKEFTFEAGRADSITEDKLKVIRKYPVTRISVNPQSMRDKTLKLIGRHHSKDDVIKAFEMARAYGFDNINMDMILGLPGENETDVEYTLEEIYKLKPESLTVHSLAIKRASRLREFMDNNPDLTRMNYDKAMSLAKDYADKMNMQAYYLYRQKDMAGNLENTGFAIDGKYGIYNILMMEEVQSIIACGAGTVSKRVYGDGRIERCDTVKDVDLYISKIAEMIDRKRNLFGD